MSAEESNKVVEVEEAVESEQKEEILSQAQDETEKKLDEKMGKRESAIAKDVVEMAKKEDGSVEVGKECLPAFFVEESDRHRVSVDILFEKKTGIIKSISRWNSLKIAGVKYESFQTLSYTSEWFEFSIPGYEEMASYKRQASKFDIQAGRVVIDEIQKRGLILMAHLKDWSLRDRNGKKIELKFDEDGTLSEESSNMVGKIFPSLVDVVVTLFETDVTLT